VDDSDCRLNGTDSAGICVVTVNSSLAGQFTAEAAVSLVVDSITLVRSESASVTYVDAQVAVTPESAVNGITEAHTFTISVSQNDSSGWLPVGGVVPAFTFSDPAPQILENTCAAGTDINGACILVIKSATAGTYQVTASSGVSVSGVLVERSASAQKVYAAGSLRWSKVDQSGSFLGGAAFEVCRVQDRFGSLISAECYPVADNQSPDEDPLEGKFSLSDLALGSWTIRETLAPAGYLGDYVRLETLALDVDWLDGVVESPWVNSYLSNGQITPTGTTCEQFVSGTAGDLTQVLYGVKAGKINNVAPGVFFYYTKVTATGSDPFSVEIRQVNDHPGFANFMVQNLSNIRLYNADCTTAMNFSATYAAGQVVLNINSAAPGQEYIVSVKYETGSVVGSPLPNPSTVQYDFYTVVDGMVVDQDADGVKLKRK
jgi:hypothetical protein